MRKLFLLLVILSMVWISCNRSSDSILNRPPDPQLVKTITKDTTGRVSVVAYYNQWGMISDSGYSETGELKSARRFDYNAKGIRIYYHWYLPVFYKAGNHWAGKYFYDSDTILRMAESYTNDKLTTVQYRFYGAPGQPSVDSFVHLANPGVTLARYSYDAQGRTSNIVSLNAPNDTSRIVTYLYSTNRVEEQTITIDAYDHLRRTTKDVTEYRSDGKILSETGIDASGQVVNEITYAYDAAGRLTLKKTVTGSVVREEANTYDANGWLIKASDSSGSTTIEQVYTNNSAGKPEKMEKYSNGKLMSTTFYYYQ